MPLDFELRDVILADLKSKFYVAPSGPDPEKWVTNVKAPDGTPSGYTEIEFNIDFKYTDQFEISSVFRNNETIVPNVIIGYPITDEPFATPIGWTEKRYGVPAADYAVADPTLDHITILDEFVPVEYDITVTKAIVNEITVATSKEVTTTSRTRLDLVQRGVVLGTSILRAREMERSEDSPNSWSMFRFGTKSLSRVGAVVNPDEPLTLRFTKISFGEPATDLSSAVWENSSNELVVNTYYYNPYWREGSFRRATLKIDVYAADKKENGFPGQGYVVGSEIITTAVANEILKRSVQQWVTELDGVEMNDFRRTNEAIEFMPEDAPATRATKTTLEIMLVYEFGVDIAGALASITSITITTP